MVEVIQADRDAAIALMRLSGVRSEYESEIETGDYDDNFFVQSFAKHRLASTPDNPPVAEGFDRDARCPIDGMDEGCSHSVAERKAAFERAAIPAGMVPWNGGDSAPDDWDGGPVLLRGRVNPYVQPPGAEPLDWGRSDVDAESDILAYTPNPDGGEVPFAFFRWNENWGVWEQVVSEAASDEGVVAAYRTPHATNPASDRGEVERLREALKKIARANDEWDPDAKFASTVLAECSNVARQALSASSSPKDARDVD